MQLELGNLDIIKQDFVFSTKNNNIKNIRRNKVHDFSNKSKKASVRDMKMT